MLAIVVVLGCNPFVAHRPGTIVDPEVSGVVSAAALEPGSQTSYRLDVGGQEITIDSHDTQKLWAGFVDDVVVLYGSHPRPWYIGTERPQDGCYEVVSDLAFDDPGAVILAFNDLPGIGIRVPKAPNFDPGPGLSDQGPGAGQYTTLGGPGFCLDAEGRMTRSTDAAP